MKKMIAVLSMALLMTAWSGVAVANEPIDTSVLDRHAVWTKKFEDKEKANQTTSTENGEETRAEAKGEESVPIMNVRIEDRPWARVG